MKKINFFGTLLLFLFFSISAVYAQDFEGDITVTGGGSSAANASYTNFISFAQPILPSGNTIDYRMNAGVAASLMVANPAILFYDVVPDPASVSSSTVVDVSITVETTVSYIREIGYRIRHGASPLPSDTYVKVYENSSGSNPSQVVIATATLDGLNPGTTYIQWYAQNAADADGNTNTFAIRVEGIGRSISIIQPGSIASKRPMIHATVISQDLVTISSNVLVRVYEGNSIIEANKIYERLGDAIVDGAPIFNNGLIQYRYDGTIGAEALEDGKEYILFIEAVDDQGNIFNNSATFRVSGDPISELLPYPSPYNPKKGDMTIRFVIANQSSVTINIYDRSGKLVSKVIDSESRSSGENRVTWRAKSYAGDNLANGVYICEIITKNGGTENRRYKSFAILRK